MTANAQELLNAFDALPDDDKQQVAIEILRRLNGTLAGDLPERTLVEAANELFCSLDQEEAGHAQR